MGVCVHASAASRHFVACMCVFVASESHRVHCGKNANAHFGWMQTHSAQLHIRDELEFSLFDLDLVELTLPIPRSSRAYTAMAMFNELESNPSKYVPKIECHISLSHFLFGHTHTHTCIHSHLHIFAYAGASTHARKRKSKVKKKMYECAHGENTHKLI